MQNISPVLRNTSALESHAWLDLNDSSCDGVQDANGVFRHVHDRRQLYQVKHGTQVKVQFWIRGLKQAKDAPGSFPPSASRSPCSSTTDGACAARARSLSREALSTCTCRKGKTKREHRHRSASIMSSMAKRFIFLLPAPDMSVMSARTISELYYTLFFIATACLLSYRIIYIPDFRR